MQMVEKIVVIRCAIINVPRDDFVLKNQGNSETLILPTYFFIIKESHLRERK